MSKIVYTLVGILFLIITAVFLFIKGNSFITPTSQTFPPSEKNNANSGIQSTISIDRRTFNRSN